MSAALPFIAVLLASGFAAYHRLRLAVWAALTASLLVIAWLMGASPAATAAAALLTMIIALPLLIPAIRKPLLTAPALRVLRKALPPLSQTERIALETGSVGFEGDLFNGKPDWNKLLAYPKPQLTAEEQAFLDGPVEELCRRINDWEITHVHADLPPELWDFLKRNKFFGMIIPKEYGGLGFSALAHHKVIQKIASISSVVSATVGVPNSLGPGELIHLDIKKLGRFDQPGHRITGTRVGCRNRGAGWDFVHVAVDDATRLAYVEVLGDERKSTTTGFLLRALRWFRDHGIQAERVMTDNGSAYRSGRFAKALRMLAIRHIFTRPYTPKTNGKAERFIQTLLRE